MGSPAAPRRARGADRRREARPAARTPTAPGLPRTSSTARASRRRLQNFAVDITDEGVDKGVVPVPAGSHPDFFRNGNPHAPAGSSTRRRPPPATRTPATAAATAPTSPRSPPGFNNQTGADGRGRAGLQLRARDLAAGEARRDEDLQLRRATSTSRRRSPPCATPPTRSGARISNNSWGAAVGGAYNADVAGVRLPRPRRRSRASPATSRSPRSSRPATPGPAANTIGSPGHGEERDHGRRLGERARDRRHRRLRRHRHRREQRQGHHRLLQPRPDRRRPA